MFIRIPIFRHPEFWTSTTRAPISTLVLRPYQEQCLQACLEAIGSGTTRIGVSLPTGTGKTTIFVNLLARLPNLASNAKKALIVVNRTELVDQAAAQARTMFPSWHVELEQGKYKATGLADVTVATVQTLLSSDRLAKFDPRLFKAIIVDEAHHAAAPSYRTILSHFNSEIRAPGSDGDDQDPSARVPVIGFSATFSRHDGLALGSVFQHIVFHQELAEMFKDSWLSPVRFTVVKIKMNLNGVTINARTGDYNSTSLSETVNTAPNNTVIIQTWLDRKESRKSTLVFCVNIAHVKDLTMAFRSAGVDARYVVSSTPVIERRNTINDFREGKFPVLVNCGILTEGTDIPNIDCILVCRPTKSLNLYYQMIGRGMRLAPGKTDCRILDFIGEENIGVVASPTLFGLDPDAVTVEDESLEAMQQLAEKGREDTEAAFSSSSISDFDHEVEDGPQPISVTYKDYDDPFSFTADSSGAPHIFGLSKLSWVGCGEEIYVLECLGKGYIRVELMEDPEAKLPNSPLFFGHFVALKDGQRLRARQVLKADTLRDAIRAADTYALKVVVRGPLASALLRSSRWRRTEATDAQKKFLSKMITGENGLQSLTKGEAANIITRLKHGARKRYEKKKKTEEKAMKRDEKAEARKKRGKVEVGPLA